MATVAELIRGAFRTLGVLASGETPKAAEQADALEALNDMLDSWAGERLLLFATLRTEHPLTPSLNPHTIGTAGTFNTTRPVRVERASVMTVGAAGQESPLHLLTDSEWQATGSKTSPGSPSSVWVESSYPLLKFWLNPVPNAADTLVLYTWQQLGRFASAAATFDLPPGYARAISSNLALELAPSYGLSPSQELARIADESKSNLKRLNQQPSYLRCDAAILGGGHFNLITGE